MGHYQLVYPQLMAAERKVNPPVLPSIRAHARRLGAIALLAVAITPGQLNASMATSYLGSPASSKVPFNTAIAGGPGLVAAGGALATPAPSAQEETTSSNWSGFVETTGPYTAITGTFVVPSVSGYLAGSTVSEWVGIDGWADKSLIQAGVNEIPQKSGAVLVEPWWEVLPAPQKQATGIVVAVGDRVTVTISKVSGSTWRISMTDNTSGGAFSTDKTYKGQLSSAEWIVEANERADGTPTQLAHYGPQVSFTKLGVTGPQATVVRVVMNQKGERVSTPSATISGAMSVSYGNVVPRSLL